MAIRSRAVEQSIEGITPGSEIVKSLATLTKVAELAAQWEECRQRGVRISIDELCRDSPELRSAVEQRLRALESIESMIGASSETDFHATDADGSDASSLPSTVSAEVRFTVVQPHASGGLGEVALGRDEVLGREVAIKFIRRPFDSDDAQRKRFLWEAEITSRLEHPGIVPVYAVGQTPDGKPSYVMRFVRGPTLRYAIAEYHAHTTGQSPGEQRLALRQLLHRVIAVCNTAAYAHAHGVIHRDIKPANVIFGKYGETLLVDWGLAKLLPEASQETDGDAPTMAQPSSRRGLDSATAMGSTVGTPGYMSPEQATGKLDRLGPASDIYSLGSTLYAVLVGRSPFEVKSMATYISAVERGNFPRPRSIKSEIPRALEAICLKSMSTAPGDRYESALDLAADLEHWLADEPVSAWPEPWATRARRWLGRHRAMVVSLFVASTVSVVILAVCTVLLNTAWKGERSAKVLAQKGEQAADRERQVAQQEKLRADLNAKKARDSVNKYFTLVSDADDLKGAGLEELRGRLLGAAKDAYVNFVREDAANPAVRAEQGLAHMRLATILELTRPTDEVAQSFTQAKAVFSELQKQEPTVASHQLSLADVSVNFGMFLLKNSREKEAEPEFLSAHDQVQKLVASEPDNPEYRGKLATIESQIGAYYDSTGRREEALKRLGHARELAETLVSAYPNHNEYEVTLARSLITLGRVYRNLNRRDEAVVVLRQANDRLRSLTKHADDPTDVQYRLAIALNLLGNVYYDRSELSTAAAAYEESFQVFQQLADAHPAVHDYQRSVAGMTNNLGSVYLDLGDVPQAERFYRVALEARERLFRLSPKTTLYAADVARSHLNLGDMHSQTGKLDVSLVEFSQAVDVLESILAREPKFASVKNSLVNALVGRVEVLGRLARFDEAVRDLDRASRLEVEPAKLQITLTRTIVTARKGDHAAAVTAAESLIASVNDSNLTQFDLALIFGLAHAAARNDRSLTEEERQRLAKEYLRRSKELLVKGRDAGELKLLRRRTDLKSGSDWEPVRDDPDFAKFIDELD